MRAYVFTLQSDHNFRYGVVANIIASHAIARGSIPRVGIFGIRCFHTVINASMFKLSSICTRYNLSCGP